MTLATYKDGQTPFPEFSAVLMLDDLQIGHYDSVTWKPVYRIHSDAKYYDEEQSDAGRVFRYMYNGMKLQNHTDAETYCVHVQQRLAGCELLNDDKPGPVHFWDAFGGQTTEDFLPFLTQIKKPWMISWDQIKLNNVKFMYESVYYPTCIKVLQSYLNGKEQFDEKRVRLMKKTLSDSQGLQISCLATGFYPRHINLTLFRDGQPVEDDQITGGEILPNGDGTYQMRKSLHLNLDNKLDITFDVAESDPGSFSKSVFSVLVFMCVAALIIWRKRRAAGICSVQSSLLHLMVS
uniref:Immunoglobulin C1-set domain-containing protein n=1 Tax=Sinocyclocheilus anshuiensis TaxID=1608454 RepID=A0A671K8Y0_9TELE